MRKTLQAIDINPDIHLDLVVTGMHIGPDFGNTIEEIRSDGFEIRCEVPYDFSRSDSSEMTRNAGRLMSELADSFANRKPDLVLVLGDRTEMLMGALAAVHENIHVAHIHGGERSGTIDESIRHAISKLSHFHFVATKQSKDRLVRLGENPDHVMISGAPGLAGIRNLAAENNYDELCQSYDFDQDSPIALVVFHPVVQAADDMREQTELLARCIRTSGLQALWLQPNSDHGRREINDVLHVLDDAQWCRRVTHLKRSDFLCVMANCDVMIGNSSAGIIEAASFDTPVVNVGVRQFARERSTNTFDCEVTQSDITKAITLALAKGRKPANNVYEQPDTVSMIAKEVCNLPLRSATLNKVLTY